MCVRASCLSIDYSRFPGQLCGAFGTGRRWGCKEAGGGTFSRTTWAALGPDVCACVVLIAPADLNAPVNALGVRVGGYELVTSLSLGR
jgi:hypothetical protein